MTQSRRVMSTSSGLGPSSAVGVIGSSAMPQIGQDPGPSRTISGCIGQVHLAPGAGAAAGLAEVARMAVRVVMTGVGVIRGRLRLQVLPGIGGEFRPAAVGAEVVGDAVMLMGRLALGQVDRHPADRVDRGRRRLGGGRVDVRLRGSSVDIVGRSPYNTPIGYMGHPMQDATKTSVKKRLNRVEGQVRGLSRMVDEDRYCIDIVTQIAAVRAALRKIEEAVLARSCRPLRRGRRSGAATPTTSGGRWPN